MRRTPLLVAALITLTATAACGKPATSADTNVATLVSAAPAPPASADRPRERLDMTAAEIEQLRAPYDKCMKDHGVDLVAYKKAAAHTRTEDMSPAFDQANRICEPQYLPLPPWEHDPANPRARDFALAVVKCLKAEGIRYVEVAEDGLTVSFGGPQNDARSIRDGLDRQPGCERKVAAETKG